MEKFLINDQRLKINGYPVQPLSIIAHLNYCIFRSVIISVEIDFKDSHLLFIQTFQYLKELLFSSFLKAPQEAKADAKIMPLFHSFQIFQKLFFGTAVEESFCRLHPQKMKNTSVKMFQNVRFVSESGCKGKDFFITSKLFKRNF